MMREDIPRLRLWSLVKLFQQFAHEGAAPNAVHGSRKQEPMRLLLAGQLTGLAQRLQLVELLDHGAFARGHRGFELSFDSRPVFSGDVVVHLLPSTTPANGPPSQCCPL